MCLEHAIMDTIDSAYPSPSELLDMDCISILSMVLNSAADQRD